MKLFLRRNAPLFYVLAAMLALYVPWLNRGYLNYEWATVLAGKGLSSEEYSFYLQAYRDAGHMNPLGYPFMISLIYRTIGYFDFLWLSKVPAMIGSVLIIIWGYAHLRHRQDHLNFYVWSLLLLLNPMVFAFSTSATTDVTTVGYLLISFWFMSRYHANHQVRFLILSAVFLGVSSCVKYISPYLGFFYLFLLLKKWLERKQNKKQIAIDCVIFLAFFSVVLLTEISWKWKNTGVLISTGLGGMKPNFFDANFFFANFLKYVAFLGLFTGGLPLFIATRFGGHTKRFWARSTVFVAVVVTLGWIQSKPLGTGEMDLGGGFPFGDFANRTLQTIGLLCGASLGLVIYRRFNSLDLLRRALIVGLGPYLILISASRPTQRYLIYAIPIVLLILVEALDELPKRLKYFAVGSTALGFAAVSLLGMSYLTSQGNASEEMAVWVEENNLISQTSAGAIGPHAGQHFWGIKTTEIRYEIIAVSPATESQVQERVLHREPMKVLGRVTRVYLLRELPKAP
jgi:hypothetical protein